MQISDDQRFEPGATVERGRVDASGGPKPAAAANHQILQGISRAFRIGEVFRLPPSTGGSEISACRLSPGRFSGYFEQLGFRWVTGRLILNGGRRLLEAIIMVEAAYHFAGALSYDESRHLVVEYRGLWASTGAVALRSEMVTRRAVTNRRWCCRRRGTNGDH